MVAFLFKQFTYFNSKIEKKYDVYKNKGGYLNERQKQIKDHIETHQPIKVSDLATKFPEIQLRTLKKDIQYLKQEQAIKMIGIGKGSIYISSDKK